MEEQRGPSDIEEPTYAPDNDVVIAAGIAGAHKAFEVGGGSREKRHAVETGAGFDPVEFRNADSCKFLRQRFLGPGEDVDRKRRALLKAGETSAVTPQAPHDQ